MFLQNSKSVSITLIDWENIYPLPPTTSYSFDSLDFYYILSFFCIFKKFWLHKVLRAHNLMKCERFIALVSCWFHFQQKLAMALFQP